MGTLGNLIVQHLIELIKMSWTVCMMQGSVKVIAMLLMLCFGIDSAQDVSHGSHKYLKEAAQPETSFTDISAVQTFPLCLAEKKTLLTIVEKSVFTDHESWE